MIVALAPPKLGPTRGIAPAKVSGSYWTEQHWQGDAVRSGVDGALKPGEFGSPVVPKGKGRRGFWVVTLWEDERGGYRGSGSNHRRRRMRPFRVHLSVRPRCQPPAGGTAHGHVALTEG